MKKHKKHKNRHGVTDAPPRSSRPPESAIDMEALVLYLRRAEKTVLPIIRDMQLGPGPAGLLLALHAQMLITGDLDPTPESVLSAENNALALWQAGYYKPRPEYPYTLEETLHELRNGPKAKEDYSSFFQPFVPSMKDPPRGLGEVSGGIVKHPETNLWQIWMMFEGPCTFLGAYLDHEKAQSKLEDIINAIRRGKTFSEGEALYRQVQAESEGESRQLPYDMMVYLVEHLQRFAISL